LHIMAVNESMKFAVIGGSRGYDLLARHSFGKEIDSFELDSPFGKSGVIHSFGGETPFYFLSRHGDFGYEITAPFVNYRANIWALKLLGVERIISWSQPGSLVPARAPGSFCELQAKLKGGDALLKLFFLTDNHAEGGRVSGFFCRVRRDGRVCRAFRVFPTGGAVRFCGYRQVRAESVFSAGRRSLSSP